MLIVFLFIFFSCFIGVKDSNATELIAIEKTLKFHSSKAVIWNSMNVISWISYKHNYP